MDDSDSDSDDAEMPDVVIGPEVTTDDGTDTNTTSDENQDDTPDVYDGPLRILALHGGGDTPEGSEIYFGVTALQNFSLVGDKLSSLCCLSPAEVVKPKPVSPEKSKPVTPVKSPRSITFLPSLNFQRFF